MTQNPPPPPKFSSFRPKVKAKAVYPPLEDRASHLHEDPQAHRRVDELEVRENPPHDLHSKGRRRQDPELPRSLRAGSSNTARTSANDVFVIDRNGDPQNVAYGKLHRYGIPTYRRSGHGRVIGLHPSLKIDRDASDESGVLISRPIGQSGMHSNERRDGRGMSSRQWKEKKSDRLIIAEDGDDSLSTQQDFVPIGSTKRRRVSNGHASDEDKRGPRPAPQNVVDQVRDDTGRDEESNASSLGSDWESDEASLRRDDQIRQRNAELTQAVQSQPSDLQAWLDLIEHQEAMITLGRNARSQTMSTSERQALADIRCSIYSRALDGNVSDRSSRLRLLLGKMDELSYGLDDRKMSERWQDLLREEPDAVELWTRYLDVAQTSITAFRYDDCRDLFIKSLAIVAASAKARTRNADGYLKLIDILLYLFSRLTFMMRDAGYNENSLALWQSLLELHLFRPSTIPDLSSDGTLDALEEFWESECPRFGELDSQGWAAHYSHGYELAVGAATTLSPPPGSSNPVETFFAKEMAATASHRYPGRTISDTSSDDPFHLVLFSDISPIISSLALQIPPMLVIQAYFFFNGLPFMAETVDGSHLTSMLGLDSFLQSPKHNASVQQAYSRAQNALHLPAASSQTLDTLLATFSQMPTRPENLRCTAQCLKQLVDAVPSSDALAEIYLAFVFRFGLELDLKTTTVAKSLLRERPASLRLYNAYAVCETRSGKVEAGDRVFKAALSMQKGVPEERQSDTIALWRSWAWESLQSRGRSSALDVLLSIGGSKSSGDLPDPVAVLKTRRTLEAVVSNSCHSGRFSDATRAFECLGLMAYLASKCGDSLEAALDVYAQAEANFSSHGMTGTSAHEELLQGRVQLLSYHVDVGHSYRPALIRDALLASMETFPNNAIFQMSYASNAQRFPLVDRIRTAASEVLSRKKHAQRGDESLTSLYFTIFREHQGMRGLDGSPHAVRYAFERAVGSKSARNCPALWHDYLSFELGLGRDDTTSVKQVFFRGLTSLPWSKQYMMRAFGEMRGILNSEELRKVYGVMEEKEMRLFNSF